MAVFGLVPSSSSQKRLCDIHRGDAILTFTKRHPYQASQTFGRILLGFTDAAARATLSMHAYLQSMCALLFLFSRLKRFFTFAKKA